MNRVIFCGRLTADPTIRTSNETNVARYNLAVQRMKPDEADFISCVAFGKQADFAEKYLKKGTKIIVEGRLQTGSYTDKDGRKVYTTDAIIERHEFCESKAAEATDKPQPGKASNDGFMSIPDGLENDGLPFV